jgi:hypothetical protein
MKRHLEPLAIAANVTQASFCRMDQVLLMFSHLVMQYTAMNDPDDRAGCAAIIASIEHRWAKADQEVFVATVILNPFFQTVPFAPAPFLNNAGIHALLRRLWTRFYAAQPPVEFHTQTSDYLKSTGLFHHLQTHCDIKHIDADRMVGRFDSQYCYFLALSNG